MIVWNLIPMYGKDDPIDIPIDIDIDHESILVDE